MSTCYLVGLMYFDGCTRDEARALLPNGTSPDRDGLPAHFASIFVEASAYAGGSWVPTRTITFQRKDVHEFRILKPAEVTFPSAVDKPAHCENFADGLPKLEDADKDFEPNFINPDAIAELPILGGALEPFALNKTRIVRWTVHDKATDPITITARDFDEKHEPSGEARTIIVKAGAPVVIANTPDFAEEPRDAHDHHPPADHFALYTKIAKKGDAAKLVQAKARKDVDSIVPVHAYLNFLAKLPAFEVAGCSGTCCPRDGAGGGGQ